MNNYYRLYIEVLKKNIMLVIIAFVLLFPTFFIWAGVPIYFVGNALASIITNKYLIYLGISLSGGLIFSMYFLPINIKVARHIAGERNVSILHTFLRLETCWMLIIASIWGLFIGIFFQ